MQEIPLNANVECTDGYAGKSTHVIFDPQKRTVTHIVVKNEKGADTQDRMAPIALIGQSGHNFIHLNCTLAELAGMPHFSEIQLMSYTYDDYSTYATTMEGPYLSPTPTTSYTTVADEFIPEGEKAVVQGARVEATDGKVGTVGELLIDGESGQITHFTLQRGHIWGKKEVTLPITAIDSAEEDVIYLKLNKRAIEALPSVPVKDKYAKGDRPGSIELIARIYDTPGRAAEALTFLKNIQHGQQGALKIRNSAILVKDGAGNVKITETGDLSPRKRTVIGAVAGGLLGALAGPVGVVLGAAAGAGVGRVSTRWIDFGLPDELLNALKSHLKPDGSALVVLVEHQYLHSVSDALSDLGGVVLQHTLTDAVVEQLLEEQGSQP